MSDELTDDQISQWLEVAAPCLFAAWQYGSTPDDADPVAWFAEAYGQGAPGPVHAVHVVGDDGRTVAITGNGPRSAAHAKFMAWSSPGNVSTLLREYRAMRERAIAAERLLSDERAAHAETSRDLDALLTALGAQVTPGGQTMDACEARRVADGMRRARELVAAREVPADVEAAIASLIAAARDATNYEPDRTTVAKHLAAERSVKEETAKLRAAIAAEIKRKMVSVAPALPPIDDDAQELIDGLVAANRPAPGKRTAIATAATATVGDFVIEYADPIAPSVWIGPEKPTHKIRQLRAGRVRSWSRGGGWDAWGTAMMRVDFDLPARLITDAAEAEADPASRWPIGGGS